MLNLKQDADNMMTVEYYKRQIDTTNVSQVSKIWINEKFCKQESNMIMLFFKREMILQIFQSQYMFPCCPLNMAMTCLMSLFSIIRRKWSNTKCSSKICIITQVVDSSRSKLNLIASTYNMNGKRMWTSSKTCSGPTTL